MHDEVLKFLIWLRDEKKIILCRALGEDFFNEHVPLHVTLESLLKGYQMRPTHWDGTLLPIRDDSLNSLMPFRCPKCRAILDWIQGDEEGESHYLSCKCGYIWDCDDWL